MAKTTFVIPAEIRRLFDPAPVLRTEDPKRFEEMLQYFAECYQPKNALEWSRVWDQAVARWNLERLTGYENHVHESLRKKVLEKAEQARAQHAEAERNKREFDRLFGGFEPHPASSRLRGASADEKSAETNASLPSDIAILSGVPLRQAKQRWLSCLMRRRELWAGHTERNGITRDHFRDNPEWQEIFDLVRSGQDVEALVQNPTCETARLWGLGEQLWASKTLSLARQIVASVRVEDAAMVTAAREPTQAVEPDDDYPQTLPTETQKVSGRRKNSCLRFLTPT